MLNRGAAPSTRRGLIGWFARSALGVALGLAAAPAAAEKTADTQSSRLRRWAMVIDLRYCDGCQSTGKPPQCTTACIEGHFAPKPMEWIQAYEAPLHGSGTQFVPTPWQQCQNPPCTNVCPVGATFATPEGTVLIDQRRLHNPDQKEGSGCPCTTPQFPMW
jgi:ferredoxin